MVRFYGLCDGKIMVRKTNFLSVFEWKCLVFRKNFDAYYLICKWQNLITCRLCKEGLLFSFLIHGKSVVNNKSFQNTISFVIF